jgi:hypothetical protein
VVRLKSTINETEVITRAVKIKALIRPGYVIANLKVPILHPNNSVPGVKILNKAGIAIINEKIGIKIQVLFKKNTRLISERITSIKQKK